MVNNTEQTQVNKEDMRAAVRDLFSDGFNRKEVMEKLRDQFGISSATAYRRIGEAMPEAESELSDTYKVADLAIGALARLLMEAEDQGRAEDMERLAVSLAKVASQLKSAHIIL